MASKSIQNGVEVWTIVSADGSTKASFVPSFGGMGSSIVMPGPDGPRELLYQHDFFWEKRTNRTRGGWPFLFPVCGRVELDGKAESYRVGEESYSMPIHGFAPRMGWAGVDTGHPDEVVLQLFDTDTTRARYPFAFEVALKYRVERGALTCSQTFRNQGPRPMPWYGGFHPYFRTPLPGEGKEDVRVDFTASRRLLYNETLTDVVGEVDPPAGPFSATDPGINEMLVRLGPSKETRLHLPDGLVVHMEATGKDDPDLFPYAQFYTMPDKPFFCVEPWMGYPNSINHPGVPRMLAPGATERGTLKLWVTEGR